ncbi:hypothetical protein F2Q69_00015400 [Brassica cretica]|uniref:Xylanase inhibitor N-terminal domain-containing protein n=1 Tax=Brassica cretica TaxID=69181 RepID=A0A8S9R203_BRACR|nr:hypothetical protein F2Q69_00015400 [Brassica cretica]
MPMNCNHTTNLRGPFSRRWFLLLLLLPLSGIHSPALVSHDQGLAGIRSSTTTTFTIDWAKGCHLSLLCLFGPNCSEPPTTSPTALLAVYSIENHPPGPCPSSGSSLNAYGPIVPHEPSAWSGLIDLTGGLLVPWPVQTILSRIGDIARFLPPPELLCTYPCAAAPDADMEDIEDITQNLTHHTTSESWRM